MYITTLVTPYKPKLCTKFNLERIAIAESKRERSLNQRTGSPPCALTSDRASFNLFLLYLLIIYALKIALLV